MDRYYQALELPLSATQEQIKNQYKQLVRLYHPDRFLLEKDKSLAEEKLKGINEAYDYLANHLVTAYPVRFSAALDLIITPTLLDFGTMAPNKVANLTFQVQFNQGIAENADFICSEEESWFKVVRVSHIYGTDSSTLEFAVQVDTNDLAPQTYQGWIDVYLNGSLARVPLSLEVAPTVRRYPSSILAVASSVVVILFLVGVLAFTYNTSTQPQMVTPVIQSDLGQLSTHELNFSLLENEQLAVYALSINDSGVNRDGEPKGLGVTGRSVVGSVRGQRVAYLGAEGEIHLLALSTGQKQVVTSDGKPKAALNWSADGEWLAYLVGEGGQSRIGLYSVPRGVVTELPGKVTGGVSHYAWSPDGKRLLFDLWQGKERRVYRIAVDGSGLHPLTRFDSWDGAWSADGRSVVVSSPRGLYRLDSQGRTATQVSQVVGESPSWSVDGNWLAYLTQEGASAGQELWLIEVASGKRTLVATESVSYAWSPTGALLGYVTGRATGVAPLLYLWTALPGQPPQLVAEVNDPFFHWTK